MFSTVCEGEVADPWISRSQLVLIGWKPNQKPDSFAVEASFAGKMGPRRLRILVATQQASISHGSKKPHLTLPCRHWTRLQ